MSIRASGKAEAGIAHIAVIIMLAMVVIGMLVMYFMVKSEVGTKKQDSSTAEDSPANSNAADGNSSLQINQRNTSRQNDASKLLAAAAEYVNNNSGNLPTQFDEHRLSGGEDTTPSIVTFEMYKTVTVESGEQAPPGPDELRLVTGATCGNDGKTVAGSTRSFAAQYVLEKVGGGYTYDCKEG